MADQQHYVQVVDPSGNKRWTTVTTTDNTGHTNDDVRRIIEAAGSNWQPVHVFSSDAQGKSNVEGVAGQTFDQMTQQGLWGEGRNIPPEFGTLPMGQMGGFFSGSRQFGEAGKSPGFEDVDNPATVLRSFLNQQGIGARSGVGQRAEAQLTPAWDAVKNMFAQTPGYAMGGASFGNEATLANLLSAEGLQGVTGASRDIFNILAAGPGGTNIDPQKGEGDLMRWAQNLTRGALIGQNPESEQMINRMIETAADRFLEQRRLDPEKVGAPQGNIYSFMRDAFGAGRFDPQSPTF